MENQTFPVGTWVTVVNNIQRPDDRSWQGNALRIEGFDYPYFAVRKLCGNGTMESPFSLDSRRFSLKAISAEYLSAMGGPAITIPDPAYCTDHERERPCPECIVEAEDQQADWAHDERHER